MEQRFFKVNNNLLQYKHFSYSSFNEEFVLDVCLDNIRTHTVKLLDANAIFYMSFEEHIKYKWNDGLMYIKDYINCINDKYKPNDIIREEPIKTIVGNGYIEYIYDLDKLKLEANINDDFKIIS